MPCARSAPGANSWLMAHANDFHGFIFDYGGVLVLHQTDEDRLSLAQTAGMEAALFDKSYWAERLDYDRGLLTASAYWNKVAAAAEITLRPDQVEQLTEIDTVSWMRYDQPMWDWIDELRIAGKRVAMLSNMPLDLGEALKARTDRLAAFDHVTLSYELRAAKPEPVIYESCLDGLGTAADTTLFLDDRLENITGAEMLGIQGIQFTSRDKVLPRLRS